MKSTVGFVMSAVSDHSPTFGKNDLAVICRDRQTEVWTMRPFKAGELVLAPQTTELKDAFWTANKSVKVLNSEKFHPEGKPIALDGRLRATPAPDRLVAPFSMVTRVKADVGEAEKPNMAIHYTKTSAEVQLDFSLPVGKKRVHTIAFKEGSLPQMPVMYNPEAIKKETRLTVLEDIGLQSLMEDVKARQLREAAKAVATAKPAGASTSGSKPAVASAAASKGKSTTKQQPGKEQAVKPKK